MSEGARRALAKELWEEHYEGLLLVARVRLRGNPRNGMERPEDIVMDLFSDLLAGELRFSGPRRKLAPFLRVPCGRRASKACGRARWTVDLDDARSLASSNGGDPFRDAEVAEIVERVRVAFEELPKRMREAARRRWLEGMTREEVGAELGVSEYTVREHLYRAKKRLRLSLEELAEEFFQR